ncbi:hypothetical protein Dsin_002797 [Dipteronia sinensis]|uniref:Uncharacterized protein n=1 Tax=Dipteronia sinensis TaxID=43782 RepID=A0AAE0EJR6_9ROSI|nr:hypothetical protein Dsin_002797 [Dipteronia sinensis]
MIRGCDTSLKIWEDLFNGVTGAGLSRVDWCDLMFQNLSSNTLIMGNISGYLFFVVNLWFIWKWRSKGLFDLNFKLPLCTCKIIMNFVIDWLNANTDIEKKNEMKNRLITWTPPLHGWIKLNVDESLNPDLGTISA